MPADRWYPWRPAAEAGLAPLLAPRGAFRSWCSVQNTLQRAAPQRLTAFCVAVPALLVWLVMALAGAAVPLVSENLDESLELSDRIVVIHGGKMVHETPGSGADAQSSGAHMLGSH